MAKSILPGRKAKSRANVRKSPTPPIRHTKGRGLVVSTTCAFTDSPSEKLICAKTIVQAVVAAHDAGSLESADYDISWPLYLVIELLAQVGVQVGVMEDRS